MYEEHTPVLMKYLCQETFAIDHHRLVLNLQLHIGTENKTEFQEKEWFKNLIFHKKSVHVMIGLIALEHTHFGC